MIHFNIHNNFNLNKIAREFQRKAPVMVNDAADIIVSDIKQGIEYGRDIHGKQFAPLKPSTIQAKRAKGSKSPRTVLKDTGMMQKLPPTKRATSSRFIALIGIAQKRREIGRYHQEGIKPHTITARPGKVLPMCTKTGKFIFRKKVSHPGTPPREWFGVSNSANKKIGRMVKMTISKIFRSTWN